MVITTGLLPAMSKGQRVVIREVGRDHRTGGVTFVSVGEDDPNNLEARIHVDGESEETFRFVASERVWRRVHYDPFNEDVAILRPGEPAVQIEAWC